jgi:hypothetical protein
MSLKWNSKGHKYLRIDSINLSSSLKERQVNFKRNTEVPGIITLRARIQRQAYD